MLLEHLSRRTSAQPLFRTSGLQQRLTEWQKCFNIGGDDASFFALNIKAVLQRLAPERNVRAISATSSEPNRAKEKKGRHAKTHQQPSSKKTSSKPRSPLSSSSPHHPAAAASSSSSFLLLPPLPHLQIQRCQNFQKRLMQQSETISSSKLDNAASTNTSFPLEIGFNTSPPPPSSTETGAEVDDPDDLLDFYNELLKKAEAFQ